MNAAGLTATVLLAAWPAVVASQAAPPPPIPDQHGRERSLADQAGYPVVALVVTGEGPGRGPGAEAAAR